MLTIRQSVFTIIRMTRILRKSVTAESFWQGYRDNFSRHLLGVTRYLQTRLMDSLFQQHGHTDLRLSFAPYITLIGLHGQRPSELAEVLGISRQACHQATNQIEAAGYITRIADPADGRAILLVLTKRGRKLRDDGLMAVSQVDQQFARLVGQPAITDASKTLGRIYTHLGLDLGLVNEQTSALPVASLGARLPRLADYILQRLMELTQQKGHPGLQLSFGQVLTLIGQSGGKIQQIAKTQDVSKQAISAIASELEKQGYLRRDPDPTDARQVLLQFTDRGRELIIDSVASVEQLEKEFIGITSKSAITRLKVNFRRLYQALHLEQDIFGNGGTTDVERLAQQIQQQLGSEGSRALAQHLLNPGGEAR